jgi:diguanylate cyclase (GGDEF)-like protein
VKGGGATRGTGRLFVAHAAVSLVPVLVLAGALAVSFRGEARRRGVAQARSEAELFTDTAVEPLLGNHSLADGLRSSEQVGLYRLVERAVHDHTVLRFRVRDRAGNVIFSNDGSGFGGPIEDEVVDASRGRTVVVVTHLNSDSNDTGAQGTATVEVYMPLRGATGTRINGVLEIYLPYAPISKEVSAGLHRLYNDLGVGLAALALALFAIATSVTKGLRREVDRNAFLAQHDSLTDLPNRTRFHERAAEALAAVASGGPPVAIAIIDLDRFKEVNDTLGHHNGDHLLIEIARRLASNIRPGDLVARLGGDEFGVLLCGTGDPVRVLNDLRRVIDAEVEVSALPLSIEASVGYVVAPEDGIDVDELMQRADVAMYVAKAQHLGVVRYDAAIDNYDSANLSLVAELRHAIAADQLVLHYQPKTTLLDGRIEAVETLVRWQHPVHGMIYPDRFLPLAEQTDLIDALTEWVLHHSLRDIKDLGPIGEGLSVAVNVSARNLSHPNFASHVVAVLGEYEVAPSRLIVEITETALLADPARAATVLAELSAAGVRVSLDDFGCGQTSLGYLSALPLHELKIDKSFVMDMLVNHAHASIVRSIVDLGHNLALRVVGEGVETDEIRVSLRGTGCDVAQGYFFARPMPVANLRDWLISARASAGGAPSPSYA